MASDIAKLLADHVFKLHRIPVHRPSFAMPLGPTPTDKWTNLKAQPGDWDLPRLHYSSKPLHLVLSTVLGWIHPELSHLPCYRLCFRHLWAINHHSSPFYISALSPCLEVRLLSSDCTVNLLYHVSISKWMWMLEKKGLRYKNACVNGWMTQVISGALGLLWLHSVSSWWHESLQELLKHKEDSA